MLKVVFFMVSNPKSIAWLYTGDFVHLEPQKDPLPGAQRPGVIDLYRTPPRKRKNTRPANVRLVIHSAAHIM